MVRGDVKDFFSFFNLGCLTAPHVMNTAPSRRIRNPSPLAQFRALSVRAFQAHKETFSFFNLDA